MLARGLGSYHPVAGGTRVLASPVDAPNVLDLSALGLSRVESEDGDLMMGAMTTLQEVVESPRAYEGTAGLLPAACRFRSASRMIRGMSTLGGESVHAAHDSEVAAALLALNAVYLVTKPDGPVESPALRFLRKPREDLAGGGLLTSLFIPGAPEGAALERVAVLPSAPSLVAVAVTVSFSGERLARARVAVTGLEGPPSRVLEAEAEVEGSAGSADELEGCAEQVARQARDHEPAQMDRPRPALLVRLPVAVPYFTSGRIEITVNGALRPGEAEARTTLLEWLRREGYWGVKHGCETGECGACTVLLDGRPVTSCLTLALRAHGRSVTTVEGLGGPDRLHPIQAAFVETGAIQCGYCTPAMELCAKALLDAQAEPSDAEIRDALAGCLCRCTGYVKPVEAVRRAAREGRST